MATLGATYFDLLDKYKLENPDGSVNDVIELLMQLNPILMDAIAVECNKGTTHLHSVRTGLPSVTWGRLYKGIPQGKSRYAQVEDTTGWVEGASSVDTRLLKLGNEGAIRLMEAKGYLEAMSQELATRLFYGNTATDPEQFMGLAPRFNSLSAANGNQIVNAAGAGSDNTSIWFVTWGDDTCHALYPKGTQAGVMREDKGEQRVLDADNNAYYVKEELFSQHMGLAVKDWRFISRVANIDVSNVIAGSVDLYGLMRKAYYKLQNRRNGTTSRLRIYMNRDILEALDALATNKGTSDNFVRLGTTEIEGREVRTFRGIPITECDAIVNTESVVA